MPTCPDCQTVFKTKHFRCLVYNQRHNLPANTLLPIEKRIDTTVGTPCPRCGEKFLDLNRHKKCSNPPTAGSSSSSSSGFRRNGGGGGENELNYRERLVLWVEPLKITIDGFNHAFENIADLVDCFLDLKGGTIIALPHNSWLKDLTTELQKRGLQPDTTGMYQLPKHFICCDMPRYGLERPEDFEGVNHFLYPLTRQNLCSKWTIGQYAYDFWKNNQQQFPIVILQGEERRFSCAGYYGARQAYTKGKWQSSLKARIEDDDDNEEGLSYEQLLKDPESDIRFQLDVHSMYPAVMMNYSYPVGQHRWITTGAEAEFKQGKMGLYEVKLIDTVPNRIFGILPRRVWNKKHTISKLDWNPQNQTASELQVYTNVDLQLALEHGYEVEFSGRAIVWDQEGRPFDDYVKTFYDLKCREIDPARKRILKQLLVTLYGKMSQKAKGSASVNQRILTEKEVEDYFDRGVFVHCDENGNWRLTDGDPDQQTTYTKPNHLGCFILSWSRVLMMKVFETVDFDFDFSHTDSIRVSAEGYHRLVKAGLVSETELGKLGVEYGIIYESEQVSQTGYQLKVLTSENKLKVVTKGRAEFGGGGDDEESA